VDALVAAKHANVGLLTCRQLFFGIFDQTIHSRETSDTAAVLAELHPKVKRGSKWAKKQKSLSDRMGGCARKTLLFAYLLFFVPSVHQ
jgi:Zn-dependent oligopeptidase